MYIFGYGSLVNIESAQKSFNRELKTSDFIEITLTGFEKVWNSIEYIIFENEPTSSNGIFLNLQKNAKTSTNGILLKISDEEFEFLKLREKNYSCIEIPHSSISPFQTEEKIYTFITTNKDKIATKTTKNCFIPKKYIKLLEKNLSNYTQEFQEQFKASYNKYPFEIKDGTYKFIDPIQNKFAKEGIKENG